MIAKLLKWRDDRHRIAELRFAIEDADKDFRSAVAKRKLRRDSDAYQELYMSAENERELAEAEISDIETENAIRRARAWGVPIPPVPYQEDVGDQYWYWCRVHGRFYLNDNGTALLRRESYAEMEMRFKPWLTWLALIMSGISLMYSLWKS